MVKFEKGSGSQNGKPTCVTCGKRHYGECLIGTDNFFGCGKNGHKVRDFPTIASEEYRIRKFLQVFRVMMLQRRIASMHSELEEKSRMRMMIMVSSSILSFVL